MEFIPPGTLEAFGLYLTRTSALVVAAPLLGTGTGFATWRIGLIVALSFLLYTAAGAPLDHTPGAIEYGVLVLRELLVGLFLAFILQIVLVAVRVAGEMIGTEMGFNMASQLDPITNVHTPVITQFYEIFFYLGLLAVNGHHLLFHALERSFVRAPIGVMTFSGDASWMALTLFQQLFAAGITIAAPVLVLLTLASLLVAFVSRVVPQINVMEVGVTARIAIGMVALLLFAPLLAPALDGLYGRLMNGLDLALDVIAV